MPVKLVVQWSRKYIIGEEKEVRMGKVSALVSEETATNSKDCSSRISLPSGVQRKLLTTNLNFASSVPYLVFRPVPGFSSGSRFTSSWC